MGRAAGQQPASVGRSQHWDQPKQSEAPNSVPSCHCLVSVSPGPSLQVAPHPCPPCACCTLPALPAAPLPAPPPSLSIAEQKRFPHTSPISPERDKGRELLVLPQHPAPSPPHGCQGAFLVVCPALSHQHWVPARVPLVSAGSEDGLSGCFAEGVTSNTSDSESSSSKCASLLLSHLCVCVFALPSRSVPVVSVRRLFLPAGGTEMLGQLPSRVMGCKITRVWLQPVLPLHPQCSSKCLQCAHSYAHSHPSVQWRRRG